MKKQIILSGLLIVMVNLGFGQTWSVNGTNLYNNPITGNVGIGTSTPIDKLQIDGGIRIQKNGSESISGQLYIGNNAVANNRGFNFQLNAAGSSLDLWAYDFNNFVWNRKFTFTKDGAFGIGTNVPTAKLTVNGNCLIGDPAVVTNLPAGYKLYVQTGIITEKVKVQLVQWADYVFDKNYKLKSLEEVSNFIKQNKHLPGVPSAEELKSQGGLDVAQMDAKLMEKIEELTLYVIQLNEKNAELAKRLVELEARK